MVGFVVVRVALQQRNDLLALAQGLAVGLALWGLAANFAMFLLPGMAGASAAWIATLGIGARFAWREPSVLRLPARTAAIFVATALAVFWLALAGRQLLSIADDEIHHGLATSIRVGGFPPVLPWNPGQPAPYHYGIDMLVGLLAPPVGPDLAFMNELLGAYIWTSLALVVIASVFKIGGGGTLALCPLLLTAGAWTLFGSPNPPHVLQVPVPTGAPGAGLRTALAGVYWPSFDLPLDSNFLATPPNSWRPSFPLAYALAFIVLERIAARRDRTWTSTFTMAAILGFVGIVDESIALIGLALWSVLELTNVLAVFQDNRRLTTGPGGRRSNQHPNNPWPLILRAAAGPALAIVLLATSGGVVAGLLTGSSHAGISLEWHENPSSRRPLGEFAELSGGVGILGLGPLVVAIVAVLLAWRNPLVRVLAVGSGAFLVAALVLRYDPFPADISRMDGHARNLALLALLIALSLRLAALPTRYRYIAAACLVALITWPTVASPVRALSLALERGPQFSNMSPGPREFHAWFQGRQAVGSFTSELVADYIREHTPVDARVLSPHPSAMTIATGRPNASGFADLLHIIVGTGPEYKDAIRFLEPVAIRKLGINYVHATDTWVAGLPDRAVSWLNDPTLFERLVRDGTDALYRIRPAFLALDTPLASQSFEALGHTVPASSSVYLSPGLDDRDALRVVGSLSHAEHFGEVDTSILNMLSELPIKPLGNREPDVIVTSSHLAPAAFMPNNRQPIWWNNAIAVYAPGGLISAIVEPPPQHFSVELSDVHMVDGRISFTATFIDRATERWTGQDWVVISADNSRWRLPDQSISDRRAHAPSRQFSGHLEPVGETKIHEYLYLYRFDPRTATLTIWDGSNYAPIERVDREFGPGEWVIAARLLNRNREVALIPVLQFALTASGEWTYESYDGSLDATISK